MALKTSKIRLIQEAFRHKGFIQKLPDLFRMVKFISKGDYKPDLKGFILPGLALIYAISPIDVIPDWFPIVGQMDDLAVLALAMPALMKEVEKFLIWEDGIKNGMKTIDVEAQ
ncbi:TPA: DUF1232 domain-containing protein [Elizabethkingia meningoseptica]|uniref:YkvA family protein n=1 Tax=Elizabethkingia meningoseptica TaxID=238 RepID=UPI0022F165AA|nr:YkvA family protein [Elizabethkingia meningoseptica]EJK5329215.1 DUF1232 domain-containing protein [Elizabethkingia meningoseptica]WBS73409.1 YkvA family protein [Elizabethkingia meningoseptica]HAY3561214.1 DUF1232 domain-containing protein [Elizabethkingia meningoseptica]